MKITDQGLSSLEHAVLLKLLDGEHPILASLRLQAAACLVKGREYTGCGFVTSLQVSRSVHPVAEMGGSFCFGDVVATINGMKHGAGFLLYVESGHLDAIEAYSYDEPWPKKTDNYVLEYVKGDERDLGAIIGHGESGK